MGTALALQVHIVGMAPVRSLEQFGPLAVFIGLQAYKAYVTCILRAPPTSLAPLLRAPPTSLAPLSRLTTPVLTESPHQQGDALCTHSVGQLTARALPTDDTGLGGVAARYTLAGARLGTKSLAMVRHFALPCLTFCTPVASRGTALCTHDILN